MCNNQTEVEFEKETLEVLREIAEDEGNTINEQVLKMMATYTTLKLVSKTDQLQESLQRAMYEQ